MVTIAQGIPFPLDYPLFREMFEARRRVFVDLLKWNIPVLAGRFEVDQFDDDEAVYLIVSDDKGRHAGSARLLKTTRPHILDSLFPELCEAAPPRGEHVLEITRFCLSREQNAAERLQTRNHLVSALVLHARESGIETYTGVAEIAWLQQILAFGWRCRPLGLPRTVAGKMLGALRIDISSETPALLEANGIFMPTSLTPAELPQAA